MTEQQQAAMRQALEWFQCFQDKSMSRNNAEALADEVVAALSRALEPVAEPRKQPAYRAVKTVHEGKAYYVSEPEQQPAVSDEPVAWMWRCKPYCDWPKWSVSLKRPADSGRDGHKRTEGYEDIPLYTRPQPAAPQQSEDKKQWVGLTSEQWFSWWQVSTIMDNTEAEIDFADFLMIALAVQDVIGAKLREKNA